ncbi:MAG TPA: hypothetical protein DCQ06_00615 [Myxococcales bacterium]|nr:hypothetical protein [Myxococcales bacterium]HAN30074.1 hypothetical protein [Myxococcales bacterium]
MNTHRFGVGCIVRWLTMTTLLAAIPLSPTFASTKCKDIGITIGTKSYCNYGAPVVTGSILLVPRACRFPPASKGAKATARHTIELRDAKTGKKLSQTSLPARPTDKTKPPLAGTLIAGPYPLYVWTGGIAAVDPRGRKMQEVFQATGKLAGVARHEELLAIVDALKPTVQYPQGSLEWTIIDFGAGKLRGQKLLGAGQIHDLGFRKRAKQLLVWLQAGGRRGRGEALAPLTNTKGKALPAGELRVRMNKLSGATKSARSGLTQTPSKGCPVVDGLDAARPLQPWVSLSSSGTGAAPKGANQSVAIAQCVTATPLTANSIRWVWVRAANKMVLKGYRCPKG